MSSESDRRNVTQDIINCYGAENYKFHEKRRTGRSTALMFEIMLKAYWRQGTWIEIRDHFGGRHADEHLAKQLRITMTSLGYYYKIKKERGKQYFMVPKLGPLSEKEAKKEGLL